MKVFCFFSSEKKFFLSPSWPIGDDAAMNWDDAAAKAGHIAQSWTREQGPGGAIILFDARDIRVEASGGLANLDHALPFRADTAARYASVSKHFFAALLLTGTGVGLDDRLGDHLILPAALAQVTIGRALDMTGGLPDLMETLWLHGVPPSTALSRHRLMDAVQRIEALNFSPGREISYSNTGYRLVQAALLAKGVDVAGLIRARLCRRLGLTIRLVEDQTEPVPGLATGYWRSPQGWRAGRYGLHYSASGGLVGTALDLVAWGQALLTDRAPVPALLDRLSAPRRLSDGRATGYGLGLARTAFAGRSLLGHGGSLPGFRTHLLLDPATATGVVVLSNREDTDAGDIALQLMATLHGAALPPPAAHLPQGLFATEEGPFWLLVQGHRACFMGATEPLFDGGGGWAVGRSAHLPMRLSAGGGGLIGEIGHVPRAFRPVAPRVNANPAWAGRYGALEVEITARTARIHRPWAAPLELRAMDSHRALALSSEGPWTQQICITFQDNGLTLATNRARTVDLPQT
jgi:CubicO group peptidase (beta-lactamase class C family)